jgi:hypothetical protein
VEAQAKIEINAFCHERDGVSSSVANAINFLTTAELSAN